MKNYSERNERSKWRGIAPLKPTQRRVYLDELTPGDTVTLFSNAYPLGCDVILWDVYIDAETTRIMEAPFHQVQWLVWAPTDDDYKLTKRDWTGEFASDCGLINPNPPSDCFYFNREHPRDDHYVVARGATELRLRALDAEREAIVADMVCTN